MTLSVETAHGTVGVVHAQAVAQTWSETVQILGDDGRDGENARERALWSRMRYDGPDEAMGETRHDWAGGCSDIRCVVTGHSIVDKPEQGAPIMSIDTGAWRGSKMTLARLDANPIETVSVAAPGNTRGQHRG